MDGEPRGRLRDDFPFRRIGLVLSGGGALGAYEVGVLRALERAGLRPHVLAGVSVGAINAVLWLAHGFRTDSLEREWSRLRPSTIGMRWVTLLIRAVGAALVAVAAIQVVLTLAGSPELSPHRLFLRGGPERGEVAGTLLDALAWLLLGALGAVIARGSRTLEGSLARLSPPRDPLRLHRWFGRLLAAGLVVHLVTWGTGVPWPQGFSASVLLLGWLVWFTNRPGGAGDRLRRLALRILPEAGGRGLWGSDARRRLLQRVVADGDPGALVAPETHLIVNACAIETGIMAYFVNWADPSPHFCERIGRMVGCVEVLLRPEEVIEAAVASSAIPAVFEPVPFRGREFVDGGVFGNQLLNAVLADGADAVVVVLVSPSGAPPRSSRDPHLLELAGRLPANANWRNLQAELAALPLGWTRRPAPRTGEAGPPVARLCVIEPEGTLPGGLYGYSTANAAELKSRGEQDAWTALAAAGWLGSGSAAAT